MSRLAPRNFSVVIAFLVPGFAAVALLSFQSPRAAWLFGLVSSRNSERDVNAAIPGRRRSIVDDISGAEQHECQREGGEQE